MEINFLLNAERAILSAIIFNPEILEDISSKLQIKDFYLPFHQYVYDAILELEKEDKPIDEEFIKIKLDKARRFDEVAMLEVLATNPIANYIAYIEELKEARVKREILSFSNTLKAKVEEGEVVEKIISFMEKGKEKIEPPSAIEEENLNKKTLEAFRERVRLAKSGESSYILDTGLTSLNRLIKGFKGKRLMVLGARPSMGKSALMTSIADHALKHDVPIFISSLEMSDEEILDRFFAKRMGIDMSSFEENLKEGRISQKTIELMDLTAEMILENKNFAINYSSNIDIDELLLVANRQYRKKPFKIWFIDHLRFIKGDSKLQRYEQVAKITTALKAFAKKNDVDIFLLSQLSKDVVNRKGNKPNMADLRESGAVAEDADIVMLLHRDSYYKAKEAKKEEEDIVEAEIIVDKNRNGPIGTARVNFEKRYARFVNSDFSVKSAKVEELMRY